MEIVDKLKGEICMKEILKGVIDLHLHAGPSVAKREVDAGDMVKEAVQYGYRGFLIKDHYFPTMMSAILVEKHLGSNNIKVFGGLAINNSIGGFNIKAIDTAYEMGAKMIWMPTVSSKNHIDKHEGHFGGAGYSSIEEKPIVYVDEKGNLVPEVIEVLKYMATKPELVLATGHGSAREIDAVITQAVSMGVEKILVNHPYYLIGASMDDIKRWAGLGVYIELNACLLVPGSKWYSVPIDQVVKILENVPIDHLIVDSDLGQKGNGSPVEGLYKLIVLLMNEAKVTEKQINMMVKETPAMLMGI